MPDKSEFNLQNVAISLIAGITAAVIFAVVARGGFGALVMALVAPLPLVIVAFGFGVVHAATSAIVATVILSIMIHPVIGMAYAMLVALPAWGGAYVAAGAPRERGDLIRSNHATWGALVPAIVVAIAVITWIVVATFSFGSFDEAISGVRGRVFIILEEISKRGEWKAPVTPEELSGQIAYAMPAALASYALLIHIANLWLGGRIAQASELLGRPWPDIAMDVRFPRIVLALWASGLALGLFAGPSSAIGMALFAVTTVLLAIQGLAVVHGYLRGTKSSALALSTLYFVLGLLVVPLGGLPFLFLSVVGAIDAFRDFRARFAPKAPEKAQIQKTD